MKKVIIFLADGTEEVEALTPLDYLRRAGADVTLAGISGVYQRTSHGIEIKTDAKVSDIDENTPFDMVVIPGGMPGTNNIEENPRAMAIIKKAAMDGKFIGAICAAPKIIGALGLLSGKKATCYPGFEKYLLGATAVNEKAVRDENFITATGAGAANEFAFELIAALYGKEEAEKTARSVRFLI